MKKTAKLPKPVRAWAVWNGDGWTDPGYRGSFDWNALSKERAEAEFHVVADRGDALYEVRIVPVAKKRRSKKP